MIDQHTGLSFRFMTVMPRHVDLTPHFTHYLYSSLFIMDIEGTWMYIITTP